MTAVSKRMSELGTENAFVVLNEVKRLQAQGHEILNFCIGQPDFCTPAHICESAKAAIDSCKHGYTPSNGIPALRTAAARMFSDTRHIDIAPDDVVIGCGGKPFIWYSIFALTDPNQGDEVIYPNPGFPIYQSMIRGLGAVPVPIYLRESNHLNFSIDDLTAAITPKTKLLILNSPHNPTGSVMSRKAMEAVAEVCIDHDIWVLADEVYSRIVFDAPFCSIASVPGMMERTIMLDCASKTYSMTGWRIGYAANRLLAPFFTRLITNSDSCAPIVSQEAVVTAITSDQKTSDEMVAIFKRRRDLFMEGFRSIPGLTCHSPGGAIYVWPNVTEACRITGCNDSDEFRKRLLMESGVACLADIHFGPRVPGEGQHLRFSCASSSMEIGRGLEKIDAFVRKHM
ncbi:pyridoxal phosphate-dependent aminotransferase [bacterium]|nr:pyridoxal phosphate-dependent aminotransferase [candidate division CSSED10-310 bacterium]